MGGVCRMVCRSQTRAFYFSTLQRHTEHVVLYIQPDCLFSLKEEKPRVIGFFFSRAKEWRTSVK